MASGMVVSIVFLLGMMAYVVFMVLSNEQIKLYYDLETIIAVIILIAISISIIACTCLNL